MNDRQRGFVSLGVIVLFSFMLAGTSKRRDDPSAKSSSSGVDPMNGLRPDIDVVLVTSATGCATKPSSPGCKLLRDFDTADTYVDLPAGKVIWYGESYGIGGAPEGTKEPFFVNVEKNMTGWGVAARSLIPDNAKEKKDAEDLLAATKVGAARPASEAASFMRTAQPPGGLRNIVKTKGRSHVLVETPSKVYLRRAGNRLLILEYSGSPIGHDRAGGVPAIAWIAETWILK
jgi:hypothetical protein